MGWLDGLVNSTSTNKGFQDAFFPAAGYASAPVSVAGAATVTRHVWNKLTAVPPPPPPPKSAWENLGKFVSGLK
jgi:hypothetical protein